MFNYLLFNLPSLNFLRSVFSFLLNCDQVLYADKFRVIRNDNHEMQDLIKISCSFIPL